MKKAFTLLLVAFFGYLAKSHACDCLYIPTFCETITYGSNGEIQQGTHVYLGAVSAITATGIEFIVQKTYFGEVNTGQTLSLESGNGGNCVLMLENFQVGETFIIAPHKGVDDLWRLAACGVTVLEVINGEVRGPIAPGISKVQLSKFSTIADCGDLAPDFPIQVNPTLTSNEVTITTKLPSPVPIQVTVFDAAGRLVHQTKEPAFDIDKTIVLNMEAWAAGVYFVRMDLLNQRKTVRVVKVGG